MTEAQQRFIDRIDKLEARYKNDKYATSWLMDRELLIAVRDEMKQPVLFTARNADVIDFFQENGVDIS
jgi:hypothetical protein